MKNEQFPDELECGLVNAGSRLLIPVGQVASFDVFDKRVNHLRSENISSFHAADQLKHSQVPYKRQLRTNIKKTR